MTDKPTPTEFAKSLTGFEILDIEDQFHREFNALGNTRATLGMAWALLNRSGQASWREVKAMSMKEIEDLFAPETTDEDDADDPKATGQPT